MKNIGKWFVFSLIGYLIVAILVLAMIGIPTYVNMYRSAETAYITDAKDSLHSLSTLYSNLFEEMDKQGYDLRNYTPGLLSQDPERVIQLYNELTRTAAASNWYNSIALVYVPSLFDGEALVYSNAGEWSAKRFFSYAHRYRDWPRDEIYDSIAGCTSSYLRWLEMVGTSPSGSDRMATYVVPLKHTTRNTRGIVLFTIPQTSMTELIRLANLPVDSLVIVRDEQGGVVCSFGAQGESLDETFPANVERKQGSAVYRGTEYLLYDQTSEYNGWRYELLLPKIYIENGVRAAMKSAELYLVATLVAALILSLLVALHSGRPVRRLVRAAERFRTPEEGEAGSLHSVEKTLTRLGDDNRQLSDSLRSQRGAASNYYLQCLFNGNREHREEILSLLREDGLLNPGKRLRVLVLRIDGGDAFYKKHDVSMRSLIRYGLTKLIGSALEAEGLTGEYCEFGQGDHVVLLLSHEEPSDEETRRLAARVNAQSAESFRFTLTVGVSQPFDSIDEVPAAYERALHQTEMRYLKGYGCVLEAQDDAASVEREQVWREIAQMTDVFRKGSAKACREAVDSLAAFLISRGDSDAARAAMREARLVACRWASERVLLQNAELSRLLDEAVVANYETIDQARTVVLRILDTVEEESQSLQRAQKSKYVSTALRFVDDNLADPTLNIERAAEGMGVSASLLTKAFREHSDTTFAQYLDARRMQKACSMLRGTDLKLVDILDACGYGDKDNFGRKFKRQFGITPMEYRKRERGTADETPDDTE